MDSRRAPKWVFPTHPPDQISQTAINLRPPCPLSGFPAPKSFEAGAMPPKNCHPVEPPGPHRAGSAKAESSIPATPGHSRTVEDEAELASKRR